MKIGVVINNIVRDNVSQIKEVYQRYNFGEAPTGYINPYELDKYFPIDYHEPEEIEFDPNVEEVEFKMVTDVDTETDVKDIYDLIYNDAAFEVFARAEETVPGIIQAFSDLVLNNNDVEIYFINGESPKSKNATLQFLSLKNCSIDGIIFPRNYADFWNYCDVLITDHPDVLATKPADKICIKLAGDYNTEYQTEYSVTNPKDIFDLELIKQYKPMTENE